MPRKLIAGLALVCAFAIPAGTAGAATADVVIESAVLVNNFQVQVIGSITCSPGNTYSLSVEVLQQGPARELRGGGTFVFDYCSMTGKTTWVVTVTGGPFKPGEALVRANGGECDFDGCSSDLEETLVRLSHA